MASSGSTWNGFQEALRRLRRNDPGKAVSCGVGQGGKFSSGTFASSRHYHHVLVEKLAETVGVIVGHDHFTQVIAFLSAAGALDLPYPSSLAQPVR
jgi:hypothetical protein